MADEGFLSRWSRRKQDVRAGKPREEKDTIEAQEEPASQALPRPPEVPQDLQVTAEPGPPPGAVPRKPPGPSIEDVRALTFESDFRRFVAPEVAPEVKNAAVKKLFADPRFNVRDMMDVYADDYSQPDPLPESMLRQLASAQFLRLFEENADDEEKESVAQSPVAPQAVPEPPHADPDLRLQQDDAPAAEGAGDGVERGAGAPHDPVPPPGGRVPEGDPG
jgi:hypothetical protein